MDRPTYLSSFVGRQAELHEIRSHLRDSSTRLLTLVGPGGSGKTRLANEIIGDLDASYEDGTAWVDLTGLSIPSAVPQTVASALDIKIPAGQSALEALASALCPREMLIVVDNCEHVAEACAELLGELLRECSQISILTTSRIPLSVQGEHIWTVPPMSYPAVSTNDKSLAEYDAAHLFVERARQVMPNFSIENQDESDFVRMLDLLDGQPLAIELAAARLNAIRLPEVIERLEDQLSFLSDRAETADPRHQSMAAAIRWSYDLLSEEEAILFRRLGVFAGTFSLEAAEQVCGVAPFDASRVLDLVETLIRHSLVVLVESEASQTRYRLLEAVRQFARRELRDSNELGKISERHQSYFAAMTAEAEAHMFGPGQHEWTQRLERDYANIQSALEWMFLQAEQEGKNHQAAAEMVASLFWPWNYMERYQEAITWYEQSLELSGLNPASKLYADLVRFLGTVVWLSGDFASAKLRLEQSLQVSEKIEYEYNAAQARLLLGIIDLHERRIDQAIEKLFESEAVFRQMGEARELSITNTNLGSAFMEQGNLERAREFAERAVAVARASQDPWAQGLSLQILGNVIHRQGEPEAALPIMEEALELLELVGQRWLQAETLWREATILNEIGEHERAVRQLERCFALSEEIGAREWQLSALQSLGFIAVEQNQMQQAIGYFSQVFQLAEGEAYGHIKARVLLGVAEIAARADKWGWAEGLWRDYQAVSSQAGISFPSEESHLRELLRAHSNVERLTEAVENEAARSLEQVARDALEYLYRLELHAPEQASSYDLQLLALGPTDVYLEGRQLVASDWTFAKPKELLFYLASNPPKTKEEIGLVFWPEASPEQLRAGLRAALYHLRKALGKREWILYEQGAYQFNREMNYTYDLEEFERRVRRGQELAASSPNQAIEVLEEAISLYRGDFVADLADDDWAGIKREALRRTYQEAAILLSELLIDAGHFQAGEELLRKILDEDPLFEQAHRVLMRCYAEMGEQALITQQYERVVEVMHQDLGVEPSQETVALYQSLTQHVSEG